MSRISGRWWAAYAVCLGVGLAVIIVPPLIGTWEGNNRAITPAATPLTYPDAAHLPEWTLPELLDRMRFSRESIRSYRMHVRMEYVKYHWDTPLNIRKPSGELVSVSQGEWMEKGAWFRVLQHRSLARVSRPPKTPYDHLLPKYPKRESAARAALVECGNSDLDVTEEPRDEWAVFDGSQRVWFTSTFNCIYLTPEEFLQAGEKLNPVDLLPYPLQWGFERDKFKQVTANAENPNYQWTVAREDHPGGPRYRVRGATIGEDAGVKPVLEMDVDPNRDFLIVQWTDWKNGREVRQRTVSLQQASDGRWYAQHGKDRDQEGLRSVEFSEAEFNPFLDDRLFHWENLPFDAGSVPLFKMTTERTTTKMRFQNGHWEAIF